MSSKRFLFLILMMAFGIRLGAVLVMRDIHKFHGNQFGADAIEFDQLGQQVAALNGYVNMGGHPTAFRAPGFPFFVAAVYRIFGNGYPAQYLSLCGIGALTCGLTYLIGKELGTEAFARVAALLSVFFTPHVYFATLFASENLFAVCLAGGLLALLRSFRQSRYLLTTVAALLFGWGVLTRPFLVLAMPLLLLLVVWRHRQTPKRALVHGLLLTVGCLAVVAPWTARNYAVFGKFVFVATNGGSTFYGSNNDIVLNDTNKLGSWVPTNLLPGRDLIEAQPNEVSHDAKEWELGKQWVNDHRSSMPLLTTYKFVRFWLPDIDSQNKTYVLVQILTYTPYLLLMVVAGMRAFLKPRWDPAWLAVHVLMISCVLTALIFWGSPRFRDGNTPILMLYSALALSWIRPRWVLIPPRE